MRPADHKNKSFQTLKTIRKQRGYFFESPLEWVLATRMCSSKKCRLKFPKPVDLFVPIDLCDWKLCAQGNHWKFVRQISTWVIYRSTVMQITLTNFSKIVAARLSRWRRRDDNFRSWAWPKLPVKFRTQVFRRIRPDEKSGPRLTSGLREGSDGQVRKSLTACTDWWSASWVGAPPFLRPVKMQSRCHFRISIRLHLT